MKKIVTLFITISIIFSHIAFAQDFNEEIIGKNFHFTQEIKNIGVNSTESVFFTVDKKWEIQDGYLNLILSKSELINEDESTLTIVVNKTPIYSTKLNETKDYKETIRIPIPKENIIQGFNEIQIKTYKRISEKPCEDDINSANWIVFHEDSFIHLDFKELKDYNSLQDFPYPYIKESDIKSSVNIIIPDDFTEGEITSSMIISGYIGRLSQFKEFTCNLLKTSNINEVKNNNLIYIGSLNSAPKEISELLTEKEKIIYLKRQF
ncbi:cellulose biosynthesis cyclic di-GMP-binding regulatory protein BcsB [Clostridium senegalense]|uniref:cellulose biosynthesis cyclic di-GMP-binding regulatory protein BcsB n=1 Tax=Clostridium senegalense TaxID=1465809 RepID=UPI0002EDBA18|nr:cellulose biosynthesis cyclic di-GMP-binding regulatory protein BcsB [Clostridium senegalense]